MEGKVGYSDAEITMDAVIRATDGRIKTTSNIVAIEAIKSLKKEFVELKRLAALGQVEKIAGSHRYMHEIVKSCL
ncbi:MAG: hypothetical protein AAB340_00890 [Patescibacteria group bacterium]